MSTVDSSNSTPITTTSKVLTSVSASLSMLGSIILIVTYIAWKEIRSPPRKILVYISIADFFTAFGNMFSVLWDAPGYKIDSCTAQSFITTCSSLWSFFWTTFLALYLHCSVALKKPLLAERLFLIFTFFGWVIPLAITGIALGYEVLGNDENQYSAGWCWIKSLPNKDHQLLWMLFTGKAWEIATLISIALFYTALKCYIHKDITYGQGNFTTSASQRSAIKAERKLILIPVIFIFLRIWGTLRFILLQTLPPSQMEKLSFMVYLQGVGDSAQGFTNFLLFCFFTEKFQRKLLEFFCCYAYEKPKTLPVDRSTNSETEIRRVDENSSLLATVDRHPRNI